MRSGWVRNEDSEPEIVASGDEANNGVEIVDVDTDADVADNVVVVENISAEKIEISEGAMTYLEDLLRCHERKLTERFAETEKKLLDKIDSLETKLEEKDQVIADLQSSSGTMQTKITQIESKVAIIEAVNKKLLIDNDDLQQYGRRTNIFRELNTRETSPRQSCK